MRSCGPRHASLSSRPGCSQGAADSWRASLTWGTRLAHGPLSPWHSMDAGGPCWARGPRCPPHANDARESWPARRPHPSERSGGTPDALDSGYPGPPLQARRPLPTRTSRQTTHAHRPRRTPHTHRSRIAPVTHNPWGSESARLALDPWNTHLALQPHSSNHRRTGLPPRSLEPSRAWHPSRARRQPDRTRVRQPVLQVVVPRLERSDDLPEPADGRPLPRHVPRHPFDLKHLLLESGLIQGPHRCQSLLQDAKRPLRSSLGHSRQRHSLSREGVAALPEPNG
mmetsp:Transcript_47477/g.115622  ORF Transcript_47477/g.115622 Transcript_47477/m.115622 type:complete len:283 (+) Transcript_47477:342-1190(+)